MRIALDAMGGDFAPAPIVAGAVQAVAARPGSARSPGDPEARVPASASLGDGALRAKGRRAQWPRLR